jgi:hypothetical protein
MRIRGLFSSMRLISRYVSPLTPPAPFTGVGPRLCPPAQQAYLLPTKPNRVVPSQAALPTRADHAAQMPKRNCRTSSKTLRSSGSGAMHMVRYVSTKGSHHQIRPLFAHAFFAPLSNRITGFDTFVPEMSFRIARSAARQVLAGPLPRRSDGSAS